MASSRARPWQPRIRLAWQRQLERQGMANGELPSTGGDAGLATPIRICERCCNDAAPSSGSRHGGCTGSPGWRAPSPTSARATTCRRSTSMRRCTTGRRWPRDRGRTRADRRCAARVRPRGSATAAGQLAGTRPRVDRCGGGPAVLDRHLAGAGRRRRRLRPACCERFGSARAAWAAGDELLECLPRRPQDAVEGLARLRRRGASRRGP